MLEALLRLLNGQRPERIIWTADITYWMAGRQQAGTAKAEWSTEEGYLQLHRELGILPYGGSWSAGESGRSSWAWQTRCRRTVTSSSAARSPR